MLPIILLISSGLLGVMVVLSSLAGFVVVLPPALEGFLYDMGYKGGGLLAAFLGPANVLWLVGWVAAGFTVFFKCLAFYGIYRMAKSPMRAMVVIACSFALKSVFG